MVLAQVEMKIGVGYVSRPSASFVSFQELPRFQVKRQQKATRAKKDSVDGWPSADALGICSNELIEAILKAHKRGPMVEKHNPPYLHLDLSQPHGLEQLCESITKLFIFVTLCVPM